jgi:hypothetical protein
MCSECVPSGRVYWSMSRLVDIVRLVRLTFRRVDITQLKSPPIMQCYGICLSKYTSSVLKKSSRLSARMCISTRVQREAVFRFHGKDGYVRHHNLTFYIHCLFCSLT